MFSFIKDLNFFLIFLDYLRALLIYFNFNLMEEGIVKFFNGTKGFGFITPSNGGADLFVHVSGLYSDIREGDKVSFDTKDGQKGLNAINVKVI